MIIIMDADETTPQNKTKCAVYQMSSVTSLVILHSQG